MNGGKAAIHNPLNAFGEVVMASEAKPSNPHAIQTILRSCYKFLRSEAIQPACYSVYFSVFHKLLRSVAIRMYCNSLLGQLGVGSPKKSHARFNKITRTISQNHTYDLIKSHARFHKIKRMIFKDPTTLLQRWRIGTENVNISRSA
jgi:hypothetical protein